jgi:predicted TIM-barrel fold metal-dependent hydrolase
MGKLMMISADSHAGPRPQDYAQWLDPEYRDGVADLIRHSEWMTSIVWVPDPDERSRKIVDTRGAMARGGRDGFWDSATRMRELEAEGFVAEVIFPNDPTSVGIYFSNLNHPYPPAYRAAGCRANNRWLAAFCADAPGRRFGVIQTEPWPDIEACVGEIKWARKAGLGAIGLPRFAGLEPNQPPLASREWDPYWKACVDNGFTVAVHVGNQKPQGSELPGLTQVDLKTLGWPDKAEDGRMNFDPGRRPLWQLIMSGVFDRFPELKVTFSELRTEWIGPTLAHLEARYDAARYGGSDMPLPRLRPTDYWRRNCAAAGQLRPYEMSLRHQTGLANLMFGIDYPHAEGAWPNTREWLRLVLRDVPETEARMILGENAARMYGFDVAALAPHVERVGLEPSELLGGHSIPRELVDNLHWRAGFLGMPRRYDLDAMDRLMQEDAELIAAGA